MFMRLIALPSIAMSRNHYTKNDSGDYICSQKGCSYTAKNMNTMFYHLKKHGDSLPFKCSICSKQFLQKSTLENHRISQHATKEPETIFPCVIPGCDFSSLTKGNCRIHLLRKHMKEAVSTILEKKGECWGCSKCSSSFQNSTGFYYHAAGCLPETYVHAPFIRRGLGLPVL
jgi:hypothetical protein